MESQTIIQMISSVGFPIVMCLLMMYYIKYREDKNTETTKELNKEHTEEMMMFKDEMKKSLDNNTEALNRLAEKLSRKEDE